MSRPRALHAVVVQLVAGGRIKQGGLPEPPSSLFVRYRDGVRTLLLVARQTLVYEAIRELSIITAGHNYYAVLIAAVARGNGVNALKPHATERQRRLPPHTYIHYAFLFEMNMLTSCVGMGARYLYGVRAIWFAPSWRPT